MKIVDSSIWLEQLTNGPLYDIAALELANPRAVLVPTVVLLEVYKFILRASGEEAADQVLARMMLSPLQELSPMLAVKAAQFCVEHKLATADAMIFAHAEMEELPLVTCDRHFEGLPRVEYHAKPGVAAEGQARRQL